MPRNCSGLRETSDPRVVIDTAGLSAKATALANLLAARIATLDEGEIAALAAMLDRQPKLTSRAR